MVGGVDEMSGDCSMTATEMSRLKEWLKMKGVSVKVLNMTSINGQFLLS